MASNINISNIHMNKLLTDYAIGYRPEEFIAEQVWAPVGVKFQKDDYATWTQADAFRLNRADGLGYVVADGASALEDSYSFTFAQYAAKAHKLKTRISDQQKQNADPVIHLEQVKVNSIQDKLLLAQEIRVATAVTTVANYATANRITLSSTAQWNDASFVSQPANQHSAIIANILTGREAIRTATGGKTANRIIIPNSVLNVMVNDPGIIDLVKYTKSDLLANSTEILGSLLGMKVIVPGAMYTSALEGASSQTISDVWGKNVCLYYYNPTPGTFGLTFGSIFRARDWMVRSWKDEDSESTLYEASHIQDEKGVAYGCAYLIKNAIA